MSLKVDIESQLDAYRLKISFEQAQAGVTALFGPSGSGKTTTINAIAGLTNPTKGTIILNEKPLFNSQTGIAIPPNRRNIGYVFQDSRLFPHLSVQKNLLFGARRNRKPIKEASFDHIVDILDIKPLLGRGIGKLSGGEKQRIAIGRALLMQPNLLLLDEPLAALDHTRKNEIVKQLETVRDETQIPILLVTHDMTEVSRLANHMILLNNGEIIAQGSVPEITNRLDLAKLTGNFDAGSSYEASVIDQDNGNALTQVSFGNQTLWLPRVFASIGTKIRLHIHARDVTLTLNKPDVISAINVLPAQILDWKQEGETYIHVQLDCCGEHLLSRVTRKSWNDMGLETGKDLYVLIKASSFRNYN